jgi:hypothetical protein
MKRILTKLFFRSFGRLSDGISLCLKEGLTSGKMLDYIYRKQPSGTGSIGKWIDKLFLEHRGWEAVRIRRKHLEELLIEGIDERKGALKVIDIASGPASYILSVLEQTNRSDLQVVCQDIEPRWLEEGRAAAAQKRLKNLIFREGNAFDEAQLLRFHPDIAVSSGFYD